MDHQRLRPHLRRGDHHGGRARRPPREETHLRRGAPALQPRLGCVRARSESRHPDRLPGRPGSRRGDRDAPGADSPHVVLPGRAPRRGRRDLGRGRRSRCGVRSPGRRRGHRGPRLALDLLGERAARHRRRRRCPSRPARELRSADPSRPDRHGHGLRCDGGAGVGRAPRPGRWLAIHRGRGRAGCSASSC